MEDAAVDKADLERRRRERDLDAAESAGGEEEGKDAAQSEKAESEGEASSEGGGKPKAKGSDDEDEDDEAGESVDVDLDEDAAPMEVEDLIGEYSGYANDTLALLYTPFFVALLWLYYDETVVASLYGIRVQDFVFYFLFSMAIAPFQVVIDIIFLNIIEWYHHRPIHDYLDYMALRFSRRRARWKGNEAIVNKQIDEGLQSLDKLCFSAQHYFVQTLYVSGMTQVVLGVQALLWCEGYSIFADFGTVPTLLVCYALCLLLERACIAGGLCFGIWKIDASIERMEGQDESVDLQGLFR